MGGRVGPRFDAAKLKEMLDAHIAVGGTVVDGEEATRLLKSLDANGLYWPREGGPGTLVLHPDATRLEVNEEFFHLEQYRLRNWPTSDPQINPLLRVEIEVEAHVWLSRLARKEKWTNDEVLKIRQSRKIWEEKLAKMKETPWNAQS